MPQAIKRIWVLVKARNREYFRDKSALGWNFLFPFLIIAGFGQLFNEDGQNLYKVGVLGADKEIPAVMSPEYETFRKTKFTDFIDFSSRKKAMNALTHHRIDFLISPSDGKYWVSRTSPRGYVIERLFVAGRADETGSTGFEKNSVEGREIRYIDRLFPGILGMSMMFSALFGVGYVIVRYRKNGVLKRMSVTPLKPWEFLTAQILSRMFLLAVTTFIVYAGCNLVYGFECRGAYRDLVLIFTAGGFSMVSLGVLVAGRIKSEELADGILNLITWPMMFLSGVWFSLEGAPRWVQAFSRLLPLTHMIEGARMVMNDGAGFYQIRNHLFVLGFMSALFLTTGSLIFKWQRE